MENIAHCSADVNRLIDVLAFQLELRIPFQMGDVSFVAGNEIVQCKNVPSFGQQAVTKMGTEKSRSTCHHGSHASSKNQALPFYSAPRTFPNPNHGDQSGILARV